MKYKGIQEFKKENNAVVGVVVAILLVGLFLAVMLVVQTVYVPSIMEQREAEHMDNVAYQFSLLKYAIDIQSVAGKNTPISTSMVLGSRELPFLSSDRSFGYLDVSSDTCNITISNGTAFDYSCGRIKYTSLNSYFIDQSYIYETGAIISNQSQGNAMMIKPPFSASMVANLNITWDLINVIGVGGKTTVSGFGTYPIQTQFYRSNQTLISNVNSIVIITHYRPAWINFLNSTLTQAGLTEGADYTLAEVGSQINLAFLPGINANVYVNDITIRSQIAPGWVE
jgi:hypothetical protein